MPHYLNFDLKLTSVAKIQRAVTGRKDSCFRLSHHGHALVTLYVQFLCSDWSKFDRWVHGKNLRSILKLVYFDSWSWQSFVSTCDVFNCLVYWVLVEKCVACQSRKSDFGWYRFRFSPFLMRKRVKKSRAILALLDSFQEQHSEWQAWVIIVFDVCFFFI